MHKLPELNTVGNKIPNRQAICDTLMAAAEQDRNAEERRELRRKRARDKKRKKDPWEE